MRLILSLHYWSPDRAKEEGGSLGMRLILSLHYWSPNRAKEEGGRWGCG